MLFTGDVGQIPVSSETQPKGNACKPPLRSFFIHPSQRTEDAHQDIRGTTEDEDEDEANANVWLIIRIWKGRTCNIVFVCVFMSLSRGCGIKILTLLIQTIFSLPNMIPVTWSCSKTGSPSGGGGDGVVLSAPDSGEKPTNAFGL